MLIAGIIGTEADKNNENMKKILDHFEAGLNEGSSKILNIRGVTNEIK
jgi:hypothetical protein